MKTVYLIGLLIFCLLFVSCSQKDISSFVKTLPQVQEYLQEHPNAEIRALYWDNATTTLNLQQINSDCGVKMPIKPYWFISLKENSVDMNVYLDGNSKQPVCFYQKGTGEVPDSTPSSVLDENSAQHEDETSVVPSGESDIKEDDQTDGVKLLVLTDKRCGIDCDTTKFVTSLKEIFTNLDIKTIDYDSSKGKQIFSDSGIKYLPALLFEKAVKNEANFIKIQDFLEPVGEYLNLRVGSSFDPTAEICDNKLDDNSDGKIDCDDEDCKSGVLECSKRAIPTVELFVMSHCPYGTQSEKGAIPVAELLKDKIDFKVRFLDYAMHGEKEVKEQWAQYCIQKEQESKYLPYLRCFLKAGDQASCLTEAGIDTAKLETCKTAVDTEFKIQENFNNKALWLSGNFPVFAPDKVRVEKFGIGGSPGLAINDVPIDGFDRSPAGFLKLVCQGFAVVPEECNSKLSEMAPEPGLG